MSVDGMSIDGTIEDWFTTAYDYAAPQRGEIRKGILLEINEQWAVIDVGLKHDGIVPREDMERLEPLTLLDLIPGQEVTIQVLQPQDKEGRLLLSLSYLQEAEDWRKAQEIFENNTTWPGSVIGWNRGGLLVKFGHINGFVPASHLSRHRWRSGQPNQEKPWLQECVGLELTLKVIEVDQALNRLVLSERMAQEQNRATLLAELKPGQVRHGIVQNIAKFGAFVDLGGIDGLLHISELSWRRVQHPSEIVKIGDELEVYILSVDVERERINLSLKHFQTNPWEQIDQHYQVDQLVSGRVTNVVDFGAFILLDSGVEGLLHASEMAEPTPDDPREFVEQGDLLQLRILSIDAGRQQIGLSIKEVAT